MEKYNLEQTGQEVQNILNEATPQSELTAETERAQEAERLLGEGIQQNATDIDSIEGKIPSAATSENKLADKEYVDGKIDDEKNRAQGVEGTLQGNIDAEETRAKAAEKQNADDIDALEAVVPSGATSENKLATESYVNDAMATSSATFRGTFNLVSNLHLTLEATHANIATALAAAIATADNNDFAFVQIPTDADTPTVIGSIERYKFNGTDWAYEYTLNNSGFTQAQWDSINSGITSGDVAKLAALPTNAQLTTLLAGLQSDIDGEETRAKDAELALQGNIDAEEARAKAAEKQNADDIDAIEAVIPESASSENKVATKSEIDSLSAAIEAILLLIPSAATSLNKLADKAYVNSSIATVTATFRGTYNLVNDLGLTTSATHAQISTALAGAILTADNNDYAFVQIPTSDAMPTEIAKTERYKFNGTAWEYEYDLNNSGFTADQWAAINSGITQALVSKLSNLPTNAELTTELGTLTSSITAINQKIPNAASQANKLVDTAAMESYIVQVLDVLTISYNVTSTDGHVTLSIEQVDGKITFVTLTTSDIASAAALNLKASQADLTALASRVTTAEGNITSLGGRVSTNETDIANLQQLYNDLQQSKPVPVTALPSTGQQQGVIYRLAGTTSYSDYMWNGSTWVLMATYNNAIDPRPKKASQNLVTSGGVFDNMGALDVSELNATENPHTLAQYVDLSAALAAIPTDYQKGGMSIKFVQSSDNKYVQYRLMADSWSIDINDWSFCGDDVLVENPEWIYVLLDSQKRILAGIKSDGSVEWSIGVPTPVKTYIDNAINEIKNGTEDTDLDGLNKIIAFLSEFSTSDTLKDLLDTKVDKEEGKSLIDAEYANGVHYVENPEYLAAWVDAENNVIFGFKTDGKTYVGDADFFSDIKNIKAFLADILSDIDWDALLSITVVDNHEFIDVETDSECRILSSRDNDGIKKEYVGFETPKVSIDGHTIKNIEDIEGRSEITTDAEGKIISYRDNEGVKHEEVGLKTNHLELTKEGMNDLQNALNDSGFEPSVVKIKDYNLPKFGYTNIVSETFYLTTDERYSDKNGIYLIRDYEDTNANAAAHITLDYFYIKSTLTNNGDGTYSKNANSVKLDFYPAGKVTKVIDKFYVISSLGEEGEVLPTSIEVTQIIDVPHINAWPVNKKDEHYCGVTIDFGHYLSGTFKMGIKFQGSSTLNYRKKNFRFTFYKSSAKPYYPYEDDKFGKKDKVKIGEFVRLSGFNLKANWTDSTRVKEVLMYRLIEAVWDVVGAIESYPWAKEHTAFTGAIGTIKCFPIECNVGGEYYGYDFFSLKKDGKNFLLDKDEDGMIECGTRNDTTNWTAAHPIDWEDELNDEEDWVIENQTQSNYDALTTFFAFINSRLYKAGNGDTYLNTQVTNLGSKFYVTSTLAPGEGSVTATRTNDPAYIGSDDNLYILSELTDINGTLYVTSTLVDGQPTADSVTAVLSSGGHNIYLGSDGERYLSTDLTTINEIKYVTSKIVWDTEAATEVTLIPFDKETMPERMSIEHWLRYIVCMQVFLTRDNTCRNVVLYTGSDKKKFYPFFYDLDLSWPNAAGYNQDIMIPAGEPGSASYAADMSLWENFKNEWWDEIINCYHVLRDKVLNIPYMKAVLNSITEGVPDEVLEKEKIKWGTAVNSFEDNLLIMEARLKWLDEEYYK